jgi:hypothetical protein
VLVARSVKLRVAGEAGGEAVDGEGCAVELEEAMLDRDLVLADEDVGQQRVGDELAPAAAPPAGEGVGYLVAP